MEDLFESYFSKDNIELNIDKFPNETNILYVTGLSGAGKTSYVDEYAEKYNAVPVALDIFFWIGKHSRKYILENLKDDPFTKDKEFNIFFMNYIKQMPDYEFSYLDYGDMRKPTIDKVAAYAFEFVKYLEENKRKLHGKYILEGVQIFLSDPNFYKDKSLVVIGTGYIKSNMRAIKRSFTSDDPVSEKIVTLITRVFTFLSDSLGYEHKSFKSFTKELLREEEVSKAVELRSYKNGKKEATDAVIASRLRHMADNDYKDAVEIPIKVKFRRLRDELAKEKIDHLIKLVIAAETTNDRISIDIHNDAGGKSVIADFDGQTHIGLHVPRGQHNILNQDVVGRRTSTGYGENDKFIKTTTGKDLPELLNQVYADRKRRVGLQESEFYDDLKAMYGGNGFDMDKNIDETLLFEDIMLLSEGRRWDYYKYVREHTNNVKKAYRWMKKNIPEIFLNWKQKIKTDFTVMKHDLSKWQRKEFEPYSKHFKGTEKEKAESQEAFQRAWNHHQKVNKHHWQYWVLVDKNGHNQALDMPFENIVEMIADWWSFSWKTGKLDEIFGWYAANKPKMILSPKTASTVEMILGKIKTKLHQLENEKKLDESVNEFINLDEDLSDPYEELEEDFYDGIPLDEETYLFCEDCERRLAAELNESTRITKEQAQYADYLTQHITNVKRGYFWIKENAPEILEGCDKEKVEANLIVHDESKYSNEEYDAYSKFFYGERTIAVRRAFKAACMHHFMNNPHHPEWWMGMDVTQEALVEALCDWWSFSWKENNMNDIFDFWKKARKHKFGSDMTQNSKDRMQVLIEKLHAALDRANML